MKVAIVGGHQASEMLAPFDDNEWQIWALGNRCNNYPRITKLFEIHDNALELHNQAYIDLLCSQSCPVVVSDKFPAKSDNLQIFPYSEVKGMLGKDYLTSSFAYMISLAILEGATEIALYGMDLSVDNDEYFYQRPCAEGWMHYAMGRGIKVTVHEASSLGRYDYIYGKTTGGDKILQGPFTESAFKEMAKAHADKANAYLGKIEEYKIHIAAHNGAAQAYTSLAKVARATESGIEVRDLEHSVSVK